ncbi:LysR family transcriptional regulator [Chromobacterium violaceum]|uniref:Probable transcriptional activator n=1 Tax=Chromobacterium violaceum (strain ATCC 12472 / DSM 30191 / JCM 1249 / CCUG 213 / NBRC 12614 / NCIMB 9131 / NCTC 9757 / MK) TaxID=243365 RepID=Q7P1J5_CHRVO|nr:LysR family transcriptional regulator [Chromobacterium violaceum]AAQ57897.1 probable transcriptional activator [Chromobacterium violaceum ATCC 12472]SUX40515.1 HTH-type transcriptional regulator YofA [Chromobacterium violaceum]
MTGDIDTGLLRALAAVARHGSINRAAAELGHSQPALSLQLRKLERHCGQTLLQRSTRGVTLTPAGQALLPYAERIVCLAEQMLPGAPAAAARSCRVGLIEDVVSRHLPRVLADFAAARPGLKLEARVAPGRELSAAYRRGELDLLIANPRLCGLEQAPAWSMECALPWLAAGGVCPDEDELPLVLFAAPCSWRDAMLQALQLAGRRHRVVFESSSLLAVQAALEAGLGVGALLPDVANDALRPLPPGCLPALPPVPLALYRHAGRDGDPELETLSRLFFRELSRLSA